MYKVLVSFVLVLTAAVFIQVKQKEVIKLYSRLNRSFKEVQTWFEKIQNLKQEDHEELKIEPLDNDILESINGHEDEEFIKALKEPKLTHPERVTFKVGQIVQCINDKASGVIVGWVAESNQLPHYLVLTDTVEANVIYDQLRYLAQNEIASLQHLPEAANKRILNLGVSKFFEGYTNGKYVMRPWLQNIYPRD